jgi:hypothetical protein
MTHRPFPIVNVSRSPSPLSCVGRKGRRGRERLGFLALARDQHTIALPGEPAVRSYQP